jgi:hypothetical protein
MGRMNGEGLVVWVPCSCSFESAHIGPVAKLSLRVTSDDLVVVGLGEPQFLLLWGGLSFQRDLQTLVLCF